MFMAYLINFIGYLKPYNFSLLMQCNYNKYCFSKQSCKYSFTQLRSSIRTFLQVVGHWNVTT